MQRNTSFDFFRGVMAVLVCLGHYDHWTGQFAMPLSFVLAVDFFLVLSGFVLAASLYNRPVTTGEFLLARYLRLAPVYLVSIALTVPFVAWWTATPGPGLADLAIILIFGQMLAGHVSTFTTIEPISISWSLSAELWVGFLLLAPVVGLLRRTPDAAVALLAAVVVTSLYALVARSPDFMDVHYAIMFSELRFGLLRCALDYALGMMAFWAFLRLPAFSAPLHSATQVACIGFAIAAYWSVDYDRRFEYAAPLLFALFILSLASQRGIVHDVTKGRIGAFFGDVSYPIYLIHPLFIFLFAGVFKINGHTGAMALYLVACTAAAFALNRLVEQPAIALVKRRSGKGAAAAPP